MEQASRGAFLFRNKSDLRPHRPYLVNLTWWAGGVLSLPFGRDPRLGFLAVGTLGLLGLLAAAARLLTLGGMEGSRRVWGLVLFATGGGLGWLRHWQGRPWSEIPDLGTLLYPWAQAVISTHAIVGTGLLLGAVAFFLEWRAGAPRWRWLLCANLLGVTRPYDLAVFGVLAGTMFAADVWRGHGDRARGVIELLWLAPVLFYDALVFGLHPAFSLFTGAQNEVPLPAWSELLLAVAPAAALAVLPCRGAREPDLPRALGLGALAVAALLFLVRLPFALQLVNALGAFLLLRAALGVPARVLPPTVLALCPTSLWLLWRLFNPAPVWFAPRDYVDVARRLRMHCRDEEVLLAPVDPGLIVSGWAPCSLAIGHRVLTPDLSRRVEETRRFYDPATPASWRSALLKRLGVRYVLLQRGRGGWIEGSGFVPLFVLPSIEAWRSGPPNQGGTPPAVRLVAPAPSAMVVLKMSRETARRVLEIESRAILDLLPRIGDDFDRAVDLLLSCEGRVVVSGMGKSGLIGQKISATLASTGTPSLYLHPAEAIHGDLGRLVKGDVALAISYSGDTEELLALVPTVRRLSSGLVSLTGNPRSALAAASDVHLDVSIAQEACPLGLAPTASTTAALAMGDALAMALLDRRGFTVDDFAVLHPGGRLGRKLLRVEDLMHAGVALPRVSPLAPMKDVLFEMTRHRLGMTTVVDAEGHLLGMISDGDLRRQMEAHGYTLLDRRAGDCMTERPVTIGRRQLAASALALMEERRITSLPIVDAEGRLEGVVHLHDLWEA